MRAEEALEQSGLRIEELTEDQKEEILRQLRFFESENNMNSLALMLATDAESEAALIQKTSGFDFRCVACIVTLNVVYGTLIGGLAVAGVAVSAELAVVVEIAGLLGVGAEAVASVITEAIKGGLRSVPVIINNLCKSFGACAA